MNRHVTTHAVVRKGPGWCYIELAAPLRNDDKLRSTLQEGTQRTKVRKESYFPVRDGDHTYTSPLRDLLHDLGTPKVILTAYFRISLVGIKH